VASGHGRAELEAGADVEDEGVNFVSENRKTIEIVGIVHALGAGGGRSGQEKLWRMRFSVQPWRRKDGVIEEQELSICKPNLTDEKLQSSMDLIDPFMILRLRVHLESSKDGLGRRQASLVKLLGETRSDKELNLRADEMQKPVTIDHSFFGTFTLDRALNWYETTAKWNGKKAKLYLPREDCTDEDKLFRMAEAIWKKQRTWDKQARDLAVKKLLPLKNDLWLGDDEKEFSANQFKKRMALESVSIDRKGVIEFTYADGNLFWGHVIQVGGNLKKGLTYANIAG
jgi:hypothetical protein